MTYVFYSIDRNGDLLPFNDYKSVFRYQRNYIVSKKEALEVANRISRVHHAKIAVKYMGVKRHALDSHMPPIAIYTDGKLTGGSIKKVNRGDYNPKRWEDFKWDQMHERGLV